MRISAKMRIIGSTAKEKEKEIMITKCQVRFKDWDRI